MSKRTSTVAAISSALGVDVEWEKNLKAHRASIPPKAVERLPSSRGVDPRGPAGPPPLITYLAQHPPKKRAGKRPRARPEPRPVSSPSEEAEEYLRTYPMHEEEWSKLDLALASAEREICHLRYGQDEPIHSIAEIVGKTEKQVSAILGRIDKKARALFPE